MPRSVELTVPADRTSAVVAELNRIGLLSLRVERGVSVQPPGDVVSFEVLDRRLGAVMRLADRHGVGVDDAVSLSTASPMSVVSAGTHGQVVGDTTTLSWEEMELSIGRESGMTYAKVSVMAVAGALAALGLASGTLHLVVAAMVIAPGFEPFSHFALGAVLRSAAWRRGLSSIVRGYGALVAGAAATALVTTLLGTGPFDTGTSSYLPSDSLVPYFSTVTWTSAFVAVVAGAGGAVLLVANRSVLTAGVMIALALVPSLSVASMALVDLDLTLAGRGVVRWLVDAVLVTAASAVVFSIKRRTDGRNTES